MILDDSILPSDAAQIFALKKILPTDLSTEEIRVIIGELRAQSFFSARTTDEYLLQLYKDKIAGILNPVAKEGEATTQFSPAYVRQAIKEFLTEVGYQPEEDEAGTIKDLSSDARINLVVKTNTQLAQGQGMWIANQRAAILDEWPGQELFRAEGREKPRDWLMRWRLAGAQTGDPIGTGWTITPGERMIALKNHPIWDWIGSSQLFKDALDVVWPPFAFNSGMWVRDVDRLTMEKFGLMTKGQAAPKPMSVTEVLQRFAQKVSALAGAEKEAA